MGCTRSRGSCGFQFLASSPRPGERCRYAAQTLESTIKFRLSTLFLSVVVVATAAGWYSDRKRVAMYLNREELFQASDRVLSLAYSHAVAATKYNQAPAEFGDVIEKELLMDVVTIHKLSSEIEASGGQTQSATRIAAAIKLVLSTLDCKTSDEFMALADSIRFNQSSRDLLLSSELKNQDSKDALAAFVNNSLSEGK